MSQSLVRVSVLAGRRRVDVCLPAEVPVIQVLPDLVRGLGVGSAPGSVPRLVTVDGACLDPEQGLRVQGVSDGEMLTIAHASDHVPRRIYDDLVEAVHDGSRSIFQAWTEQNSRSAKQAVAGTAGVFALVMLAAARSAELTVFAAVLSATAIGALAVGLAGAGRSGLERVGAAWLASLYFGAAGWHVAGLWGIGEQRLILAAACAGIMGLLCLALDRTSWPLHAPAVIVPLALILAQTSASLLLVPGWKLLLAAVAAAVVLARLLPGAVVEATVMRGQEVSARERERVRVPGRPPGGRRRVSREDPPGVDLVALDRDLRVAQMTVLALGVSGSALMVLLIPSAVRSGLPATGLVVALCALRLLRLRRVGPAAHVVSGLAGCVATGGAVVASILILRPEWAPLTIVSCALVVVAVSSAAGQSDALRRGWWGDVVEVVLVMAVPTLLVMVWWSGWGVWDGATR